MARVRCYAGSRYPERPVAFEHGGRWQDVASIVRRERTPGGFRFTVVTAEGRRFELAWSEDGDRWRVSPAPEPGTPAVSK